MLLTITLSSGGRGPQKPIHGLSILKWSPRSPGPVSWVRCTNVKAVLHHWGLVLRAWHCHPSYCANSEPRSHPGHSLFHSSFCNQSSNRSCPFLLCPPPLSKPLSALGRVASVIPQLVYSHSLWSPSSLLSVLQAGWSSKGIIPKPSSPTSHPLKQGKSFHWKETIPVYEWDTPWNGLGAGGRKWCGKKLTMAEKRWMKYRKYQQALFLVTLET